MLGGLRRLASRLAPRSPSVLAAASSSAVAITSASHVTLAEPQKAGSAELGVTIKDLKPGDGAVAATGDWVELHYVVRLLGDGSVIEDTRASGYGDRDYGAPLRFELGNLGDAAALRALHPAALDMRVGGVRRVRTSLIEPHFGYRVAPRVLERDFEGRQTHRVLQGDWLIDVTVELVTASEKPPSPRWHSLLPDWRAVMPAG